MSSVQLLYKSKKIIYWRDRPMVSPKEQVLLVLLWGFAECGFRKALRLKVQGVY